MTSRLSFDKSLYAGKSVDEAVKVFAAHATFALEETPEAWVVNVTANHESKELRLTRELCNFALGLTVQSRGAK